MRLVFGRVGLTDHKLVSSSGETQVKSPMLLEQLLENEGTWVLVAKVSFSGCCMALATASKRVTFTKAGAKAPRSLETRSAKGSFAKMETLM